MKRNTAKEKKKNNKGFPYRKSNMKRITHEKKYAMVDEEGNVLEKFRVKYTALAMLHYYEEVYFPKKLKIVEI